MTRACFIFTRCKARTAGVSRGRYGLYTSVVCYCNVEQVVRGGGGSVRHGGCAAGEAEVAGGGGALSLIKRVDCNYACSFVETGLNKAYNNGF